MREEVGLHERGSRIARERKYGSRGKEIGLHKRGVGLHEKEIRAA
jgi:hypothetical protein